MKETGPEATPIVDLHDVARRPQAREREAGAAAGLLDHRRPLHGVEDLRHRVTDRQDEASRELAGRLARVHQRRRVRQKLEPRHRVVELRLPGRGIAPVRRFRRGDRARDATQESIGRLDDAPLPVAAQVAPLQDRLRIVRPLGRPPWTQNEAASLQPKTEHSHSQASREKYFRGRAQLLRAADDKPLAWWEVHRCASPFLTGSRYADR